MAVNRFNPLFDITVSLYHDKRDGSDIPVSKLREEFERRLAELRCAGDEEFHGAVGGPHDTEEFD